MNKVPSARASQATRSRPGWCEQKSVLVAGRDLASVLQPPIESGQFEFRQERVQRYLVRRPRLGAAESVCPEEEQWRVCFLDVRQHDPRRFANSRTESIADGEQPTQGLLFVGIQVGFEQGPDERLKGTFRNHMRSDDPPAVPVVGEITLDGRISVGGANELVKIGETAGDRGLCLCVRIGDQTLVPLKPPFGAQRIQIKAVELHQNWGGDPVGVSTDRRDRTPSIPEQLPEPLDQQPYQDGRAFREHCVHALEKFLLGCVLRVSWQANEQLANVAQIPVELGIGLAVLQGRADSLDLLRLGGLKGRGCGAPEVCGEKRFGDAQAGDSPASVLGQVVR